MPGVAQQGRPLLFIVLAYVISYGLGLGAMVLWPHLGTSGLINHVMVLGPALAAVIALRRSGISPLAWFAGDWAETQLRWWWLLVPIVITLLALACFRWVGGSFSVMAVAESLVPLLVVQTFLIALPEEIGWRGYLSRTLLGSRSPLATSLIVGVIWGLWHGPKLLILPSLLLVSIAISILLTFAMGRLAAGVVFAIFVHGSFNAAIRAAEDQVAPEQTLAAFNAVALILGGAALLLAIAERHWFLARPTQTRR